MIYYQEMFVYLLCIPEYLGSCKNPVKRVVRKGKLGKWRAGRHKLNIEWMLV